jgi:hypothetical protein
MDIQAYTARFSSASTTMNLLLDTVRFFFLKRADASPNAKRVPRAGFVLARVYSANTTSADRK